MRFVALFLLLVLGLSLANAAEEPSLGEKIKEFLASTPTPTPAHRKKGATKKSSPTPSPTPKASSKHKALPSPSPRRKKKASPTPSPEESASPSPSPVESAAPSPTATPSPSATESAEKKGVASLSPNELLDYDKNPAPVRKLLESALDLTTRNLGYTYGSSDPANGGMDCSGFIYFVLQQNGIADAPRDAREQYVWVRKAGNFRAVLSHDLNSFELDELKPGDLLFWTGTYNVERDPPVTHTMIYLGREKSFGKPVMVGASDGRTYEGKQRFGVSVFDFKAGKATSASDSGRNPIFVGYARIPGLGEQTR